MDVADRPAPAPLRWTSPSRPPPWSLVLAGLLLASLALHHRLLTAPAGSATGAVPSDSGLFTWWLAWGWFAPAHGLNPLYTTWQHAPEGVNALWNTTVPVLGTLLAPLTATVGPVAAFNVGMVLGPVVSGLATYGALCPYVARAWPRAVAAAMTAFSPFAVAHAWVGHLNLVWSVLPAALLWVVHAVLLREEGRRPWRDGALLGLAFAVQTGLYTQTVALGAVVLVVVAGVLAAAAPYRVAERAPDGLRALAAAGGVYLVLCAYPSYLLLAGPGRPRASIRDVHETGADAANLLVPSALTKVQMGTDALAGELRAYVGEQGSYIGPALLAVLVVSAAVLRGAPRVAAAATAVLVVLSLGTSLVVLGHDTGLVLPWRLLLGVPLVSQAEAARLAPFVALGVALVVALTLDRARRVRRRLLVGLVLLATLTWLPSNSQQTTTTPVPDFFTAQPAELAPGETVSIWPRPSGRWTDGADPLVWQAAAGMGFRQTGGYFIGSDPTRPLLLEGPVTDYERGAAGLPADPGTARADLLARGVGAVVLVPLPAVDVTRVRRWSAQVTGDPGRATGGVWLFRLR